MSSITGAEIVAETLKNAGVRHVFGVVSIHNMPIVDAIGRLEGIEMLSVRSEQSATHMADGYARATGGLGVSLGSTGPGTTNTVTGIYESAYASSRVLVVTGQAETTFYGKGKGYVHEAENQKIMLESVARRVASPKYLAELEGQLISVISDIFSARPQPGAIEIPIDLQYASVDSPALEISLPSPVIASPETMSQAVEVIRNSKRRVILAGGGVAISGASEMLREFAEQIDAPVITTPNGKGALRDDHPLHLGTVLISTGSLQASLRDADLLIAVGTRFQAGVAGRQLEVSLPPIVHIDVDPRNINLNHQVKVGVVGDAKSTLASLQASGIEKGDSPFLEQLKEAAIEAKAKNVKMLGRDHESILNSMSKYMDRDAYFVRDNTIPGYYWGNGLLPVYKPGGYIFPASGAIGPGLPLGMGVAVATGVKTIVMHGDGGFMYHIGELATAVQYKINTVTIVMNNNSWGAEKAYQKDFFGKRYIGADINSPPFHKVAQLYGAKGFGVNRISEVNDALKAALKCNKPAVINVNVDPKALYSFRRDSFKHKEK